MTIEVLQWNWQRWTAQALAHTQLRNLGTLLPGQVERMRTHMLGVSTIQPDA